MGAIEKFVVNSADRAIDKVQNYADSYRGIVSRVQGYRGALFNVAANGSTFVGLQYSQINPIRDAIRAYVKNVQNVVLGLNTEASTDNALKGEAVVATRQFVQTVSDVANAYVSSLLAYSDKMYEYGENYKASDTSLSQNITEESSSLSSGVENYTEKY